MSEETWKIVLMVENIAEDAHTHSRLLDALICEALQPAPRELEAAE